VKSLVYVKSQSSAEKIHSGATPTVSVQGEDEILNQLKNLVLTRKELSEIDYLMAGLCLKFPFSFATFQEQGNSLEPVANFCHNADKERKQMQSTL